MVWASAALSVALPLIATAYLLQKLGGLAATMVRVSVLMLTLWLFTYNGYLLIDFLLSPIRATL